MMVEAYQREWLDRIFYGMGWVYISDVIVASQVAKRVAKRPRALVFFDEP